MAGNVNEGMMTDDGQTEPEPTSGQQRTPGSRQEGGWDDPLNPWGVLYGRAQVSPQPDDDVIAAHQLERERMSLSPQASAAYAAGKAPVPSPQRDERGDLATAGQGGAAGRASDAEPLAAADSNQSSSQESDHGIESVPAGHPTVGHPREHEFHAGENRDPHALAAPRPKRQRKSIPTSVWIASGAACSAIIALAASAFATVRAVAPGKLPQLSAVPVSVLTAVGCVFAVLAIILVIAARVADSKRRKHGYIGTTAIVLTALAGMLIAGALVVGNFFPDGIIKASGRDDAPVNSVSRMETDIEAVTERCTDGWQVMDVSGYPGMSAVAVCKATRMAFVTFDSASAASMYRSAITSKISSTLDSYATDSRAQGEWRILSGERWIAFGQKSDIEALHKQWGGTISTVQ
ncbi:hypothetical protein WD012_02890 [Bifidobacterium thermophilum]